MFCDLVSSTELASRLDPEEYGEILGVYHKHCADAILRYGGHIAQFLGDGVYAYFGYPRALEDAAPRAVHAALSLLASLRVETVAPQPDPLAVRIGIHTGIVVMGDVGDATHLERIAVGNVPNVAARVQSHAVTDTVVITAATRQLLRDEFVLQPLGLHELRGVPEPVGLWHVLGTGNMARDTVSPLPMVGRDDELALLLARFRTVALGSGELVAIRGDAGIGKSRLLRAFRGALDPKRCKYYEFRCSPYHSATALHPWIEMLRRRFLLTPGEPERTSLAKLQRGFAAGGHSATALPLMAALQSISPLPPALAALTPQQQRSKLIEMLVAFFLEQAAREPVVLAVDDLHWADPSTLEVLRTLIASLPRTRALLALSFRTGFELPWSAAERTTTIPLGRLDTEHATALIAGVTRGKHLPSRLQRELLGKTEGIPMFIEESTRMLLDSPDLRDCGDRYELIDDSRRLGVPATIQDSLMARLDQLGSAKEIAQLAAILGRTFHYEVLEASWSDREHLRSGLSRLVEADLLVQHGHSPKAVFSFKHALIQDVAYGSTLKRVRRTTHARVARLLVEKFPQLTADEPETIAHHFSEAGLALEAVHYLKLAADKALAAYANLEAADHLRNAIQLVRGMPQTPECAEQELRLLIILGPPLIATQGYSSSELKHAYERAHALCREADDTTSLWSVLYVLFYYYAVRCEPDAAAEVSDALVRVADQTDDSDLFLEMCLVRGHVFWRGEFDAAQVAFQAAVDRYEPTLHAAHAVQFGQDPLVCSSAYLAWIATVRGDPERSREIVARAIGHARSIEHPHSLGCALAFAAVNSQLQGDYAGSREFAIQARELSTEHGLAHWLADADILHGFADVMELGSLGGLVRLQAGLAAWDMMGARLWRTHQLGLLAEAHLRLQQPSSALEVLSQAQALLQQTRERYYEAELLRLEGLALLQLDATATADAARCFHRAREVAFEQGAQCFEKRALAALNARNAM